MGEIDLGHTGNGTVAQSGGTVNSSFMLIGDATNSMAGSVAANGFGALGADRSLSEKDADHDFRWVACAGGAGEVAVHLDHADPPGGRCERAASITAAN